MIQEKKVSRVNKWVLIRGLIRSKYHWQSFPEELIKSKIASEVFCTELTGNGYEYKTITPYQISTTVDQLRSQVPFKENIGVIAISLGGMLAAKWAQTYPDEIKKLVIINSSSNLSAFYHRLNPKNYLQIFKLIAQNDPSKLEKFILEVTSNNTQKWQPLLKSYTEFSLQNRVHLKSLINQIQLTQQVDFKLKPKTEVLVLASQNDRLVSYKCSQDIAKQWQVPIEVHQSAGHDLPLDDPDWIIQKIQSHF